MKKPFKILVPMDFSQTSIEALVWAISMARRSEAELILLSVVDWQGDEPGTERSFLRNYGADDGKKALMENRLRTYAATSPWLAVHPPKVLARFGPPVDEIVKTATEEKVDLVVMGTHGRRGMARILMGSVAEGVVRRAPCPVAVLRRGVRPVSEPLAAALAAAVDAPAKTKTEQERHWWSGD
jgi:universal stress protein A